MEKKKTDSSVKNAVMTTVMSLVAGIVARALAKMSPDAVKKYLANPKDILGMKLPPELAATLGGGFAGLTVVEILKHLIPGLSGDILDYVQDFAVMVGERYDDVVEKGGTMTDQPSAPAQHFFQRKCLQSDAYPGVIFHLECGTRHHVTATVKEETDAKGKKRKVASTDPRSDFRTVSIEAVAALMNKNGRTPSTTDDDYDINCTCDILVAGELERYYAAEAAKKPKDPASKPSVEKPAVSLQDYLGRARSGKYRGVDKTQLDGLIVIIGELNQAELTALDRAINTDGEFEGLFLARNSDDVRKMITLANDREVHSGIAAALNIPSATAHKVVDTGKHAWKQAGAWAVEAEKRADERTARLIIKRAQARQSAKPITPPPVVSSGKRMVRFFLGGDW